MEEFDFNENKVVGYVDFILGTNNAKIEVVGYTDWRNVFHRLSDKDILKLFPPKGKIFAHNLKEKYHHTAGTLICIKVKRNEKVGDRLDAYIWDKSGGVYEYGSLAVKLKSSFSANGQINRNVLSSNNLLEVEYDTFVSSGGMIYLIKADSQERLLPYWKETSLETLNIHGKQFVIDSLKREEDGKIDITSDEQLMEWYLKNVLKKNWGQIFEQKTFRNVEPLFRDAFSVSKGLDRLIIESRIKRLMHITRALTLSIEELNELKSLPWLTNSIEQSISLHKEDYLKDVEKEKAKELKDIRDRYDMEILVEQERVKEEKQKLEKESKEIDKTLKSKQEELKKQLQGIKTDLDLLNETHQAKKKEISTLEESISRLEKRKDEIIEDFSVVREVLGSSHIPESTRVVQTYSMEEVNNAEDAIPLYQAFIKSIEKTLKANNIPSVQSSVIGQQLIAFYSLLVPDATIAKAIIMASKRCRYLVEYVSATWKSFADLWENGLGSIVDECRKNKELMHFLILQNINLTYLPNYMMPLIDLQKGVISHFPGSGIAFPNNLRILCTITNDEVMPLSGDCLQYIGCVEPSIAKDHYESIIESDDNNIGYLTPRVLAEARELAKDVPNYYRLYLDND